MMTPMRKLIMKMEDMALLVFNQCITDNGKKPENDDYCVSCSFKFCSFISINETFLFKK